MQRFEYNDRVRLVLGLLVGLAVASTFVAFLLAGFQ
jgi:hypothetical protein